MGKPSKQQPVVARRPDGSVYSSKRATLLVHPEDGGPVEERKYPVKEALRLLMKREKNAQGN